MKINYSGYGNGMTTGLATGIAQGAQNFISAYNNARAQQFQREYLSNQMAQAQELHQLQAEKLRQEVMPQDIDFAKIGAALEAARGGMPGADKLVNKSMNDAFDNVTTPAQAQYFYSKAKQWADNKTGSANMMASDIEAAPKSDDSEAPSPAPRQPVSLVKSPTAVSLNPTEREVFNKALGYETTANLAGARLQNQLDISKERNAAMLEGRKMQLENTLQIANLTNDTKKQIASQLRDVQLQIAQMRGDTAENVADIRAGATTKAATIRANAPKANSGNNAEVKSTLDTIKQLEMKRAALNNPGGIIPMSPQQKISAQSDIDSRLKIQQQRYKQLTGKDYIQDAQAAPSVAPPAAAPSAPSVLPWDSRASAPVGSQIQAPNGQIYKVVGPGQFQEAQ